jgi:hypothetical protein
MKEKIKTNRKKMKQVKQACGLALLPHSKEV